MHIPRPHYISRLHEAISANNKIILLHGGRGSWKTTLLREIISDHSLSQKKYYFSFDEDIVSKKFKNADDFVSYMQIKYGIDFAERNLLLLNEIQYSKKILTIFQELLSYNYDTQIIATGIVHTDDDEYISLAASWMVHSITVHPLSFFEFLDSKKIHTTYLTIDKSSIVIFKEIQTLFDEYLTWGWYPSVITLPSQDRKQQALRSIIQKVYDKDVWFYFNGDEILVFQDLLQLLCRQNIEPCKYKLVAKELDISLPLLKKYIQFLIDNCLISCIPYFFEDKTRELCHQERMALGDTWLLTYMTKNFGSKLYDLTVIKNFVAEEIIKYVPVWDRLMTYKKINNSSIDFVILHSDGMLTPVVVSEKNTSTVPKIYNGFAQLYGDRIRRYIKTTPLLAQRSQFDDKEFICVPHFMMSKAIES